MTPPILPIDWSRYTEKEDIVLREVETLRPYPFQSVSIPALSDEEYAGLLARIRAQGLKPHEALAVTPNGEVVDGRARLRAARQAGLPAVPTYTVEAPSEADYAVYAADKALHRRHLGPRERTAIVQAALAVLEEQARANQRRTQFQPKPKAHPPADTLKEPESVSPRKNEGATVLPHVATPRKHRGTRGRVAAATGVSTGQVGRIRAIDKRGSPELKQAVAEGRLSIRQAYETLQGRGERGNGRPQAAASSAPPLVVLANTPVKTLNTVAGLIPKWVEEDLPSWPSDRRDQFWRALANLEDSCQLARRRREEVSA